MMPWAMHFASGNSLFSGTALVLLSLLLQPRCIRPRHHAPGRSFGRILTVSGILLIALSATPWPWWIYVLWLALLVIVVRQQRVSVTTTGIARTLLKVALIVVSLGLCVWEATTLRSPLSGQATYPRLYVLGDSISAGAGTEQALWPDILGRDWDVEVVNLAKPGATAKSALEQADEISPDAPGLILVEIGGNDLLSGRPAEDFRTDLRRLMAQVSTPTRRVLLMELPLPPWNVSYGRIQRQVAGEFGAGLISKRDFAAVLSRSGSTIDHLHLSAEGQQSMANMMARHVVPSLDQQKQDGSLPTRPTE